MWLPVYLDFPMLWIIPMLAHGFFILVLVTIYALLLDFFYSYQSITPVHIKLPNGNMAIAKFSGTVQFSPGLVAKNVLYVDEFKLNLLYVPKLCVDNDCIVSFDNDKCLI